MDEYDPITQREIARIEETIKVLEKYRAQYVARCREIGPLAKVSLGSYDREISNLRRKLALMRKNH